MAQKTYEIYIHTSPSGKSYIGQTCNYKQRNKLLREAAKLTQKEPKYGSDFF